MKQVITLFFIFSFCNIKAQNLVLNPSFENYQDCPYNISFFHLNVKHWSIPNNGTTDYFNSCNEKMGFNNFIGNQAAKTGNGYAGIYVYYKKNYREYIQGELISKLKKGTTYKITFYVSLAEKSTYAISDFSIQFYNQKVVGFSNTTIKESSHAISCKIDSSNFFNTKDWIAIQTTYKAQGFENFFVIGNFNKNKNIKKFKIPNSNGKSVAYYYIDDIVIEEFNREKTPQEISIKENKETFIENTTYVFKNVLFDFDTSELLENSIIELDELYNYLEDNKNFNIEIYGHTDNVGLVKRNEELSLQRAKSVANYLIKKGLSQHRITWFGFGSSQPTTTNDTPNGRATNRRVEFKLLKL